MIQHRDQCPDPTTRESESILERGIVTTRCLGCGATVKRKKDQR